MPTPARTIGRALYSDFIDPALRRMRGWLPGLEDEVPLAVPVRDAPTVTVRSPAATTRRALRIANAPKPKPQLRLPSSAPPLPPTAAKPAGGQWVTPDIQRQLPGLGNSPESIASMVGYRSTSPQPWEAAHRKFFDRTFVKYLKTNFASIDDPAHDLQLRGITHFPREMNPETGQLEAPEWQDQARWSLTRNPLSDYFGPDALPSSNRLMTEAAPYLYGRPKLWNQPLSSPPITDPLYGLQAGMVRRLDLEHLADELREAVRPGEHLPPNLRLTPEKLNSLSVPGAIQHVHNMNKHREWEEMMAGASGPSVVPFHPHESGMNWVELKVPTLTDEQMSPNSKELIANRLERSGQPMDAETIEGLRQQDAEEELQRAFNYEGRYMGQCVGSYCSDVTSGPTRILSLRDKNNEPHVNLQLEPSPTADYGGVSGEMVNMVAPGAWGEVTSAPNFHERGVHNVLKEDFPDIWAKLNAPEIHQIRGKGNKAPVGKYLAPVQDLLKSRDWGEIKELHNAQMLRLPNGRLATYDDVRNTLANLPRDPEIWGPAHADYWRDTINEPRFGGSPLPRPFDQVEWQALKPHFEGFARGGPVRTPRLRIVMPGYAEGGRVERIPVVLPRAA